MYHLRVNLFALKKTLLALIVCFLFYSATNIIIEFYNPDWVVYERIFDDGSHLKENNRDLGFLAINDLFKIFSNNYETFRFVVAIFFCFYIFLLARGIILKYTNNKVNFFSVFFFLVAFLSIRFTIQIREGIACCVFISALGNMLNDSLESTNYSTNFHKAKNFKIFFKLFTAVTIHSGIGIFFLLFLLSYFICKNQSLFKEINKTYGNFIFYLTLIGALIFSFLYRFLIGNVYFLQYEDQLVSTDFNFAKIIYWIVNGVLVFMLVNRVKQYTQILEDKQTKVYLILVSKFLLPFVFTLIFSSILLNSPSGMVTAFCRIYNLALGILLLVLCFKTKGNSFFIFSLAFFILIDQIRTVIEALVTQELI